ncbi:flagellar filament capping protein FliD [Alphaproteobacteria bacterium]|nr:flagellar filament capping protein FliD [Alphaproteobacteria bacterium]
MTVDYLSAINQGGSGLNITQIVDSLVEAEQAPQENQIQNKIDARNTAISAIGEIKSALSKLSTSLTTLTGNTSLKVNSTSSAISATISDPSTAVAINSTISISTLAKGQTLAFEDYASNTSLVGAGSLVLERGDWSSGSFVASPTVTSKSLTVTATDTLESLKDKINALNYGVTASVLGAGDDTYTLVLKSQDGKENALRVTATESPSGSGLSTIDNTTTNGSKQKLAGTDAAFTVDGISLTRSSNTITDLFSGYNVNLLASTTVNSVDTPASLTGSVDNSTATTNLQSFITAVNDARTLLNDKTFRGSSTQGAGDLSDDPVIKSIQNQLKSLTSTQLTGFGANGVYLSNLGVRTEKDGLLSLNTTTLENELKNNPTSLDAIFNSMYSSSSSLLTASGAATSAPVAGSYAFAMTAYVSGAFTGLASSDTSPQVTASNNTIQVTVDGTQSGSVSVPAAHYTSEAALATAIQTAINADSTLSAAGKSVVVTHSNGSYSITSGSIGSSSSMVVNAIGSNLDGFLKFAGTTDADNIGTTQSGTGSTALTLNGASVTTTDPDGLVDAETRGSSGTFSIDGNQSSAASNSLNSFITINSSNNLSSVSFTITGTDINGTSQTEIITGPTAGATVTGTKIFKTVTQIESNAAAAAVNVGTKSAYVDLTGKRPSIISAGGDESGKTFTVVGTDMSGNAQTEVVTGPAANATVLGSKTFQTISSITPSANTAGSITMGFTGAGITTTGVTGSATLDSVTMSADVANKTFTITSGNAAGLKVKYSGLGADATVFYGQSLIEKLTTFLTNTLDTSSGQLSTRETTINKEVTDQSALLVDLNAQMKSLRERYIQQFTSMEQAVTSLKSTGEYLTNLFEAMNKDD